MNHGEIRQAMERMGDAQRLGNLQRAAQDAQSVAQSLQASLKEFAGLEFDGTDDTETITATVDGDGKVVKMHISAYAIRDLPADRLGPQCVQAVTAARATMSEELTARLNELTAAVPEPPNMPEIPRLEPKELVAEMRRRMEPLL